MSLSKFSSSRVGKNVSLSDCGKTARWVGNNNIRGYIACKNAIRCGCEITIEIDAIRCTRCVIGFTTSDPNNVVTGTRPSITGKVYVTAKSTTRFVKVKRNEESLVINVRGVEKRKQCIGDIWITVGLFYGNGNITLKNGNSIEEWKGFGDIIQVGTGGKLSDWNPEACICVDVPTCMRLLLGISPLTQNKGHFVKLYTSTTKTFKQKHECDIVMQCEKAANLEIIYSHGDLKYHCADIKGLTSVKTDCDGRFSLVFEIFNSKLTITESNNLMAIEDCQLMDEDEYLQVTMKESTESCTSSLESNINDDCDDDGVESTDEVKFIPPPTEKAPVNKCLSDITNIPDFKQIERHQKNVCHPNTSKPCLTTNYVKLVNDLMPFPFCDYLVEDSYISIDDQSHIMKLNKNSHPHEVNRHIISMLDKTDIDERKLRLLLKKSDLPHLLENSDFS